MAINETSPGGRYIDLQRPDAKRPKKRVGRLPFIAPALILASCAGAAVSEQGNSDMAQPTDAFASDDAVSIPGDGNTVNTSPDLAKNIPCQFPNNDSDGDGIPTIDPITCHVKDICPDTKDNSDLDGDRVCDNGTGIDDTGVRRARDNCVCPSSDASCNAFYNPYVNGVQGVARACRTDAGLSDAGTDGGKGVDAGSDAGSSDGSVDGGVADGGDGGVTVIDLGTQDLFNPDLASTSDLAILRDLRTIDLNQPDL